MSPDACDRRGRDDRFSVGLAGLLFSTLAALTALAPAAEPGADPRPRLPVAEFGAIPDDGQDDAPALNRALQACADRNAAGLVFAPGRYDLRTVNQEPAVAPIPAHLLLARNLRNLAIEGNGAELLAYVNCVCLRAEDCENLTVRGLTLDYYRPETAGRVTALGADSFDLAVDAAYPFETGREVCEIWEWDGQKRAPLLRHVRSIYRLRQSDGPLTSSDKPGVIRIGLTPQTEPLLAGVGQNRLPQIGADLIVFHYKRGSPALRLNACRNVNLEDLNIHSTVGMGTVLIHCRDVTVRRLNIGVRPGSGQWLSTRADGLHFMSCRGQIVVEDCRLENCGDDAFAIHGMYGRVTGRSGDREVTVAIGRPVNADSPWLAPDLQPGDSVEFGWGANPLRPQYTGQVEKIERRGGETVATLTAPLPAELTVGALVNNVATLPPLQLRRCQMRNSFSIGARIKTRQAVVEDCRFENCLAFGLGLCCDGDKWFESGPVRDVVIRNNTFLDCGAGNQPEGAIKIYAGRVDTYPLIHQRIVFERNLIDAGRFNRAATVLSAEDVAWNHNTIKNALHEAFWVDQSARITFSDNQVVGSQPPLFRRGKDLDPATVRETGTSFQPQL